MTFCGTMFDAVSRTQLRALTQSSGATMPTLCLGFSRAADDGRVVVLYSYPYGVSEYGLDAAKLPDVLVPDGGGLREADADVLRGHGDRAIEWQLIAVGVQRVASMSVPGVSPPTRLWIGLSRAEPLTRGERREIERMAAASESLLKRALTAEQTVERLRRLELASGLLPAFHRVLDVREIFDRVSAMSKAALPHDMLTLGLFSDDLATLTLYARTGEHSEIGKAFPQPYPSAVTEAFSFDIIDDRTTYPFERDRPPTALGMRSSMRVPFRFDGRTLGGLGFHASAPLCYDTADVIVGRRLADHVGVALSHHRLAEEGRRAAALTASLELVDELLATLIDWGEVREVFDRISLAAAKVLRHDALSLWVRLPDGLHGRVYASSGFTEPVPEIQRVPEDVLENPDWEHSIIDDILLRPEERFAYLKPMGFRSILRLPIRLDGQFAGALVFVSKTPAAFSQSDVFIGRRIADRLTVRLVRDRELEASKRADDAAERAARLEARVRALTEELDGRSGFRRVIGNSPQWRRVLTQATQVAATDTTVLLLGESGTGKEVVARFLHRASARKGGPFVALNCAALPEQLLEAELFGYERGAYTGATQSKPGQLEQAAGGTLFLDEVAEMSPTAQAKFLRVLQEREFQRLGGTRVLRADARVVAATNRDLQRGIADGDFREDLYYRLNVFAISLPPLRQRRDDILPISETFLVELGRTLGRPPGGISKDARQLLLDYHWPGNVRELRNILERAAILCDGGLITADHLAFSVPRTAAIAVAREPAPADAVPPASGELHTVERSMIESALQLARFNKSKAAKALGLSRHQLYIRMQKYGLE
jgi:two-component system NtrC family response regulator